MVLSRFFRKLKNNNLVNKRKPRNIRYTTICNNGACAVGVRQPFNKEQFDNDKEIAKALQSFNTISYMNKLANKFDQESLDRKYAINLHNKINTYKIKGRGKNKTKKTKQKRKSKKLRKIRKNNSRVGKKI
jgi:CelD/BcsL family acetyltransferase involved in cellulose biosynthesis|tara:strand:+ start:3469 stop:3861 length:393 start_codon:yes stop_codon:yes gene_type:complete